MRLPQLTGFLRRVRAQDSASGRVVPVWAPGLFVGCTIVLIPWTVLLVADLPDRQVARHWDLAWAGLDLMIAGGLLATAVTVVRRSVWTPVAATVTGTLLVVDAWFDVVTAAGQGERLVAVAMALLVELPLAAVCVLVARNVERVLEQARRYALAAGYRVEGRRLVAPPDAPSADED